MGLKELIERKAWKEISYKFTPKEISESLSMMQGILMAHEVLYADFFDDGLRDFAISVLETIRVDHTKEWESSWKYDAFLGHCYSYLMREEDSFAAYESAFKKAPRNTFPGLLVALSGCLNLPGGLTIEYMRAILYLKRAIKDYLYKDAVQLLRAVYSIKGDKEKEDYWWDVYERIKNTNAASPSLDLAVYREDL